jgi:hypothetical protein
VNRSSAIQIPRRAALLALAATALLLGAGNARAATDVYPNGGGTFSGGAQGWEVTAASCNVALLCTADGGYDGGNGNPPGSFAANTNVALNLLTLFKSTITVQSPDFTVANAGDGTLHLDRGFDSGSLVDLAPQVSYVVTLLDRSAGTKSEPLKEEVKEASPFIGKDHAVTVKAGHTYALSITAETSSTVAGSGLLAGTTSVRFDNVALSVQSAAGEGGGGNGGGKGGNGGNGAGGLSDSQLLALLRTNMAGTAVLKGNRLFVKGACPAKVGRACSLSLQGLLKKRKAATTKRTSKVAKGKAKTLVLKVKPKARKKVAKSNRLLFRETVRAGSAKATVYKRLKLIRRR